MKYPVLLFLLIMHAHFADAQNEQNNTWFEGSWNGIKSFTGARLGIRVLVRIEVDSVRDNRFYGHFIYMYPKDTIARLVKTFDGKFKRGAFSLDKSEELFLLDPRSRSFWSDCSQCDEIASLYMNDSALIFKINTFGCGDSCNGETVFTRPVYHYNVQMQAKIKNFFKEGPSPASTQIDPKQKNTQSKKIKENLVDANKSDRSLTPLDHYSDIDKTTIASGKSFEPANKDAIVTTTINAGQKEKDIQTSRESFGHVANKDQPLIKLIDKKTTDRTGNTTDRLTSLQNLTVTGTDSLPQANVYREAHRMDTNPVNPLIVTSSVDPGQGSNIIQGSKENLADTGKNSRPLTMTKDNKTIDTINNISKTVASTQTSGVISIDSLQEAKINRETNLVQSYEVNSPHIKMELFDNAEIDADIVSVYYNGKLIVGNATLTQKAITFSVDASATNRHHEFILIAENEGSLPPNTALLRITSGDKQYKLSVSTSGTKNAKIAIDYNGE